MNFEKVELYGFKSFADKAEIKFGDGITGIVGPNGCGKSNVADAIRWVLGEQSAKQLRGSSMQDVIFSGTQGRKSLSYCEVSLFFDNSNKMFSIDYNEVIITRKLFRSGESEYYINKQPARLKDIIDLLHECGIGKEGYTIIGQGKVEEIMSAKPEDRRAIFEEATGIAKFKSRKNESERKLERTHENVIRYVDILTEIENQLGPLEKQAEKTKEYNQLTEDLKYHELNTYVAKVENVGNAKNKILIKIKGIEEQSSLREKELNATQKEYEKIFSEISSADEKLRKLNDELLAKRVDMERNSGEKRLFEQKISYLQGQIERSEKEIEANTQLIQDSTTLKESIETELETANTQLEEYKKQSDTVTKKLVTVSQKIALGEELADANRKKVIESIESLTDIKVNKGTMSIELSNLTDKKEELVEGLDALSYKRESLFNEKEKYDQSINNLDRDISTLKNDILEQENLVRNFNEKVAGVDNKIYQLNTYLTSYQTKLNFYKSTKENYEGYQDSVKGLLNSAKTNIEIKKRVLGVVAELIKCDKKFDTALEAAIGNAGQNVVTNDTEDVKFLVDYLLKNQLGRVTFLPLNSVKKRPLTTELEMALKENGAIGIGKELVSYDPVFEPVFSNLLGGTLFVDNKDNATYIFKKYHSAFKIVTLTGEVFNTQGSITGGTLKTKGFNALAVDRRIEEHEKLVKESSSQMDALKSDKKQLETDRDKALDDLSVMNDMYQGKRQQVVLEREKQANIENQLIEIGKDVERVTDLIDTVNQRIGELGVSLETVSTGGKELEQKKSNWMSDADKHQAEFDALKTERDALTEKSTDIQIKITELKAKVSAYGEELERLIKTIAEAKENNQRLFKSNEGASGIIESLRLDQEKVALTKEEQDYVNGIRVEIDNIEVYKEDLRKRQGEKETERQSLTEQITLLSEKKHEEELALTKIDSDLEYLGQSIYEDYQETYETAVLKRDENYDIKTGEQEILRIRRRRSSLGSINGNAVEEYKVMKERYDEMTTQKEDLLKAEEDLRQAINTIKSEMLAQFTEGFEKINTNFQKIFKELFGGGRAMLQLDYEGVEDKLDAGVEIVAEPPGKKLQKLSLLSGGEKALTAIAILFSILKLRPMPFCVLDEIEAALDEANVDRFARYLQKFSKETQFIVITHRKPTMEMADALFGVTMQEKGVSKMVSVKLSDVGSIDDQLA